MHLYINQFILSLIRLLTLVWKRYKNCLTSQDIVNNE